MIRGVSILLLIRVIRGVSILLLAPIGALSAAPSAPDAPPPMHQALDEILLAIARGEVSEELVRVWSASMHCCGGGGGSTSTRIGEEESTPVGRGDPSHTSPSPLNCIRQLLNPISPPTPTSLQHLHGVTFSKGPHVILSTAAQFFQDREALQAPADVVAAANLCDLFSQALRSLRDPRVLHKHAVLLTELYTSLMRLGPPTYATLFAKDLGNKIKSISNCNRLASFSSSPENDVSPPSAVNLLSMGYDDDDNQDLHPKLGAEEDSLSLHGSDASQARFLVDSSSSVPA